jgi:hypothetical protein
VVCVVVDEAHRALGNHAYCQLIQVGRALIHFAVCVLPRRGRPRAWWLWWPQSLQAETSRFRVLALSATPGDNLHNVQQVLQNLVRRAWLLPAVVAVGGRGRGGIGAAVGAVGHTMSLRDPGS